MRRLDIFEVFEKVNDAKGKNAKVDALRTHDCTALRDVCRGFFDDAIQWNLPAGTPPYTPCLPESVPSTLLKRNIHFQYFVKGGVGDGMPAVKRESIFIQVLESIHPEDALILIDMINKKKPKVNGFTKNLVKEAFPGLIAK